VSTAARIWERLTRVPGRARPEVERRGRLLLGILVCIMAVGALGVAAIPFQLALAREATVRAALMVYFVLDLGTVAFLAAIYALARSGHTRSAACLLASVVIAVSVAAVIATREPIGLITAGLGPLAAGLLLSRRATLGFAALAAAAVLPLPLLVPGLSYVDVISTLIVMILLAAVAVVSAAAHERDLRQIEEQSRRIQADAAELVAAGRTEAVARLAAGIAHEFNNIMAAVMGYAEAISIRPGHGAPYARRIQEAATRAGHLTEHLLSFSRQQLLRPEPTFVNDVVRRVSGRAPRQVALDLGPEHLPAFVDPRLLERALETLVSRAARQAGHDGLVSVRTSEVEIGQGASLSRGAYRVVTVADDGPSIEREILHRIFDPYYTTGEFGTGDLELAAAYGIIKQSGGDISASPGSRGGNAFVVYLPCAPARN